MDSSASLNRQRKEGQEVLRQNEQDKCHVGKNDQSDFQLLHEIEGFCCLNAAWLNCPDGRSSNIRKQRNLGRVREIPIRVSQIVHMPESGERKQLKPTQVWVKPCETNGRKESMQKTD